MRIEKAIFSLMDEGYALDRGLMKYLPKLIYEDVWEEEWKEIAFSNWILDLKRIRKLIAKRAFNVLERMVIGNNIGVKR